MLQHRTQAYTLNAPKPSHFYSTKDSSKCFFQPDLSDIGYQDQIVYN